MGRNLALITLLWGMTLAGAPAESAAVLRPGEHSMGFLQPLRLGLNGNLELITHPVLDLLQPNLALQKNHGRVAGWQVATRHFAAYPTLFLRTIRKNGTGGIIAPDPDMGKIPQMLYWRSEARISRDFLRSLVTCKAGIAIGVGGTKMDERLRIDYPLALQRMEVLFNGWGLNLGGAMRYHLNSRIDILLDANLYSLPGSPYSKFFEHKLQVFLKHSQTFRINCGYILSYGEYPFGSQWYILPLIDFVWQWQ